MRGFVLPSPHSRTPDTLRGWSLHPMAERQKGGEIRGTEQRWSTSFSVSVARARAGQLLRVTSLALVSPTATASAGGPGDGVHVFEYFKDDKRTSNGPMTPEEQGTSLFLGRCPPVFGHVYSFFSLSNVKSLRKSGLAHIGSGIAAVNSIGTTD